VTKFGTGAAASQLNHPLGGKTGTTSDYTDAWFLGFSPSITCGVWVGYDSRQSLGEKETGAKAALPIWMAFMKAAIVGKDSEQFLSDSEDDKTLKAAVETPAKPGEVVAPTVQENAKAVKAIALVKAAIPTPISEAPAKPSSKPQVKRALPTPHP
jgi:penicillin-binding protein 1A